MASAAGGVGVEGDPSVLAAWILLGLRDRTLLRWPEWIPRPDKVPVRWPKRQRSSRRPRLSSDHGAVSGSTPSTSAGRTQPRHVGGKAFAAADAPTPKEPMAAAWSPETPLDFGAGSGASWSGDDAAPAKRPHRSGGASSSGDDAAPAKRSAPGSGGDEGCSSPAKRSRQVEEEAILEQNVKRERSPSGGGGEGRVKFAFDLNEAWNESEDLDTNC